MNLHPLWGIACLVAGIFTAFILRRIPESSCFHEGRHQNLDGLRGVLALIMFICHAATWQQYLVDGQWRISDSPLYILPGQTGIVIFFMLTAFLFTRKFLSHEGSKQNWLQIFSSRLLRLLPAYAAMLLVLFLLTLYQTLANGGQWQTCLPLDFLQWIAFTLPGAPLLCNFAETQIAVAGVTWSLTYEWVFYFSLPFLALLTGKRPGLLVISVSLVCLVVSMRLLPAYSVVYLSFAIGIASAFLDFHRPSLALQHSRWASFLAICILVFNGFLHTQSSYTWTSVLLIALAFHIFASGNTFFGLLITRTFQVFGLCTYSLYLFHGLLLYFSLYSLLKVWPNFHLDNFSFWAAIFLLTPVLIIGSLFIYLFVEHPPLQKSKALAIWIEKQWACFQLAIQRTPPRQ
jgi:peptidoglycan/LPS O-acetylase OafA/YrhL